MKLGQITIILLFGVLLLSDVYFIATEFTAGNYPKLIGVLVRTILTVGLFYATYTGKKWARILTTVLISLAMVITILGLIQILHPLFLAMFVYFALFIFALNWFPPVARFLEAQSAKHG